MVLLTRQLIVLDMLLAELAEYSAKAMVNNQQVVLSYLSLLKQFCLAIQKLSDISSDFKQHVFFAEVEKFGLALTISNKRILSVYLRLIEYVIEYYQAREKIAGIINTHFDDNAEKRLQLLQTRAIKAKAQFKTVVQAMGRRDYQQFATHLALPPSDWSWDILRLENE